jgi:16S rRNA (cytosine1402-N4)-methyltransferase
LSDTDLQIPADDSGHTPVLLGPILSLLNPQPGEVVLDCTVGRGGHMRAILPALAPGGRYIGIDADASNLQHLQPVADAADVRVDMVHDHFANAPVVLEQLGVDGVDLLLADLGFASTQVDDPQRGLSFTHEGPLDMRLDRSGGQTAADLIAELDEPELADLIWRFGEERFSRTIARKIVAERARHPITTTRQLADLCISAYAARQSKQRRAARQRWRIHPATRTFQALRIAVNDELQQLQDLLAQMTSLVRIGGRAAIISFHSLEDRLVKQAFRQGAEQGRYERLTRRIVTADEQERASNPRSRSAKLRAVRRIA